jgi:hypothetical protein
MPCRSATFGATRCPIFPQSRNYRFLLSGLLVTAKDRVNFHSLSPASRIIDGRRLIPRPLRQFTHTFFGTHRRRRRPPLNKSLKNNGLFEIKRQTSGLGPGTRVQSEIAPRCNIKSKPAGAAVRRPFCRSAAILRSLQEGRLPSSRRRGLDWQRRCAARAGAIPLRELPQRSPASP